MERSVRPPRRRDEVVDVASLRSGECGQRGLVQFDDDMFCV
jgi:hypothetical protein